MLAIPQVLTQLHIVAVARPLGENTPLDLGGAKPADTLGTNVGAGSGIVRTLIGLVVVVGIIYGTYWVLKQVKASREDRASGRGLTAVASLPLGPGRSVSLIRVGGEVHLLGVAEHAVTSLRMWTDEEAEEIGLLSPDGDEPGGAAVDNGPRRGPGLAALVDDLRRRTIRS